MQGMLPYRCIFTSHSHLINTEDFAWESLGLSRHSPEYRSEYLVYHMLDWLTLHAIADIHLILGGLEYCEEMKAGRNFLRAIYQTLLWRMSSIRAMAGACHRLIARFLLEAFIFPLEK